MPQLGSSNCAKLKFNYKPYSSSRGEGEASSLVREAALTFALVMTMGIWRKGKERDNSDLQQHQEKKPLLWVGCELMGLLYCIKFFLLVAGD